MALQKGVNSYATVEEADTYFGDRLDVAAWIDAASEMKAQALVTATSIIDSLVWTGIISDESQPLAFPRSGSYFDPRLGYYSALPTDTPIQVIKGTYELAYHLLNNDGLLDNTGTVENMSVGPIKLDSIRNASLIPSSVKRLIKPLLHNSGSRAWWRAN